MRTAIDSEFFPAAAFTPPFAVPAPLAVSLYSEGAAVQHHWTRCGAGSVQLKVFQRVLVPKLNRTLTASRDPTSQQCLLTCGHVAVVSSPTLLASCASSERDSGCACYRVSAQQASVCSRDCGCGDGQAPLEPDCLCA